MPKAAGGGSGQVAIIGGTGFESALQERYGRTARHEMVQTDFGTADLILYAAESGQIVFLPRHGSGHTVAPHRINHRANIAALRAVGVTSILSTTAVGSLRSLYEPGDVVIPDDFIDLRGGMPTTFFEHAPVVHTDFTEPFGRRLRDHLISICDESAADSGVPCSIIHSSGVYLCLNGPRYETPAEVRCFAALGADIVGMTVAPEAILARELGLEYASVSVVTNFATGLSGSSLSHAEVEQMMATRRPLVMAMLLRTCARLFAS